MLKKFLRSCLVLSTLCASARTIDPQEALSAALGKSSIIHRAPGTASSRYELARTFTDSGNAPAVYLFSNDKDQFIVTPADDAVSLSTLAYGMEDIDNMSPCMVAWLEGYARQVEWLKSLPEDEAQEQVRSSFLDKDPVAPICKTTWGQDKPYNDQCPLMDGGRAVTGCVATAMAQVMRTYRWPDCGKGSKTHVWSADRKNYTDYFDYDNNPFDWDNMIDDYSNGYTPEQGNAVATLMHACGVACGMSYSPKGSGSMEYYAASGLIEYLRYDPSALVHYRDWYNVDTWDNLIYEELAKGHPVFDCGMSEEGGHAFVCDGYSSQGFFHMNWGWKCLSDGYFLLSVLDPLSQGTGGTDDAFNYDQCAIIGLKPAEDGSEYEAIMAHVGNLTPQKFTYNRSGITRVLMTGYTLNYGLTTIAYDVAFGLKYKDSTIETIEIGKNQQFGIHSGYISVYALASKFPEGEYDVMVMYRKSGDTEWKRCKHGLSNVTAWHFNVDEKKIEISPAQYEDKVVKEYSASISDILPSDDSDLDQFIIGHEYTAYVKASASIGCDVKIATVLSKTDNVSTSVLAMSKVDLAEFRDGNPYELQQTLTIPDNLSYGPAYFSVVRLNDKDEVEQIITTQKVKIRKHYTKLKAEIVSIEPKDAGDGDSFFSGHTYTLNVAVTTDGIDDGQLVLAFRDMDEEIENRERMAYSFTEDGGTQIYSSEIFIPEQYIGLGIFTVSVNEVIVDGQEVEVTKTSGISDIATDDSTAEYYNLQGMRIYHPDQGQLVVRRTATSSKVIRYSE